MTADRDEKRPIGRPSAYTDEIADRIIEGLREGRTLKAVCRDEGMPPESTVRGWVTDDVNGFSARYATAREVGYHVMADELMDIADDGRNDWMIQEDPENPGYRMNGEAIARSRLRVDTRKWMLAKALPKIYGDKLSVGGIPGEPVEHKEVTDMTREELEARLAALKARRGE